MMGLGQGYLVRAEEGKHFQQHKEDPSRTIKRPDIEDATGDVVDQDIKEGSK